MVEYFKVCLCLILISPAHTGLNQLCKMIDIYTKAKTTLRCMIYDFYGCWCGPGGSGTPVDDVDRCCQKHDFCYDKILEKHKCSPYITQYKHKKGKCCKFNRSLCHY